MNIIYNVMKFPDWDIAFSGILWPCNFTGTTLPSGDKISLMCLYIPLKKVIILTSLIAPTVDPLDPPVNNKHIKSNIKNSQHV